MYHVVQGEYSIAVRCYCSFFCNLLYDWLLIEMFGFSGGVMIYFDRVEVVNVLAPSAGMSLASN